MVKYKKIILENFNRWQFSDCLKEIEKYKRLIKLRSIEEKEIE